MITWNYRVFREENGDYTIREVIYDDDGAVLGCTADPVEPYGQSLEDLARELEWFKEALTLPVLTLDDMPPAPPARPPRDRSKNIPLDRVLAELELDHAETSGT
ncbi:MAG: hypothetical protein ACJ8CR_11860 [Roseiflexaceae bacterium]